MSYLIFITPMIEILIIAIGINYFFSFFWKSKSRGFVWIILALETLLIIFSPQQFPILNKVMLQLTSIALVGFLIIFQPELQSALSKLSLKANRSNEVNDFDKFLEYLSNSTYRLAEKRIGAIIALENEDSLEDFAQKSVMLNANFSSELLETIFTTTTPLHDGAVIISNRTIISAASIFPLSEDSSQLTKSMGTRHRAALGLSNLTDALIIVISEETGKVSIAREGIMTRGIKIDRFKGIIRSIFNPPNKITYKNKFKLLEWLRK